MWATNVVDVSQDDIQPVLERFLDRLEMTGCRDGETTVMKATVMTGWR